MISMVRGIDKDAELEKLRIELRDRDFALLCANNKIKDQRAEIERLVEMINQEGTNDH